VTRACGSLARVLLAACLLVATATRAAPDAADPTTRVRARIQSPAVLRGEFEQIKQLQGFRNPLRSRGAFVLARGRGVIWDTREPFPSSLVVTGDKVLERLEDGSERLVLDGAASPDASLVNALLLALVGGDVDALAHQFELSATVPDEGDWTLRLVPRDAALRQVFERIALSGDRHVHQVRLQERSGDVSEIRFLQLRAEPATLSPEEAARLD
jgi:hypothetical protein